MLRRHREMQHIRKVPKLTRFNSLEDIHSEDDMVQATYEYPEFSSRSSNLKINKWLSKSQDSNGNEYPYDDSYNSDSNQNSNSPYTQNGAIQDPNNRNVTFKVNENYRDHNSPPLLTNGKLPRIEERRPLGIHKSAQTNSQVAPPPPASFQDKPSDPSYRYEARPFVPVQRPIPNSYRSKQTESIQTETPRVIEYEIQELTIDFPDEPYQTLGRGVKLQDALNFSNSAPITEPKSEARVFVNFQFSGQAKNQMTSEPFFNAVRESIYANSNMNSPRSGTDLNSSGGKHSLDNSNTNSNNHRPSMVNGYSAAVNNNQQMMMMNLNNHRPSLVNGYSNNNSSNGKIQIIQTNSPLNNNRRESQNFPKRLSQANIQPPPPAPPLPSFFKKNSNRPGQNAIPESNNESNNEFLAQMSARRSKIEEYEKQQSNRNSQNAENNQNSQNYENSQNVSMQERLQNETPSSSLQRFVKQTPNIKDIKLVTNNQNTPKKRLRETPSPFTSECIVDEAFDYLTEPSSPPAKPTDKTNETPTANGSTSINELDDKVDHNETFTNTAKKRLEEYQRKRNSFSNSSANSSVNLKNNDDTHRFSFSVFQQNETNQQS